MNAARTLVELVERLENAEAESILTLVDARGDETVIPWRDLHTRVRLHAAGLKVFPYTVDLFEDYSKIVAMNVDGVLTNDPQSARKWSIAQ